MSKVYRDDEWRNVSTPAAPPITRALAQEQTDNDYAFGRIDVEMWRARTDELSEPTKWTAAGRVGP